MLDLEKIAHYYAQPITVKLKPLGDLDELPPGYKVIIPKDLNFRIKFKPFVYTKGTKFCSEFWVFWYILPVRPVMSSEEARKLDFNNEEQDWFNHYSR